MIRIAVVTLMLVAIPASAIETDFSDMDVNIPKTGLDVEHNEAMCNDVPNPDDLCLVLVRALNDANQDKNDVQADLHFFAQDLVDATVDWIGAWQDGSYAWFSLYVSVNGHAVGAEASTQSHDGAQAGGESVYYRNLNADALAAATNCSGKHADTFANLSEAEQHDFGRVAHALFKCGDEAAKEHLVDAKKCRKSVDKEACVLDVLDTIGTLPCPGELAERTDERGVYCNRV